MWDAGAHRYGIRCTNKLINNHHSLCIIFKSNYNFFFTKFKGIILIKISMIGIYVLLMFGFSLGHVNTEMCNESRYYINNIDDFDSLKTCDIIDGNLFINAENNLDSISNLDHIKEINGYLVILDSHIINSLKGLHNLDTIAGNDLYLDEYSVVIKHNINNKNNSHQGLCYANKVDWSLITDKNVLLNNNGKNCPECHNSL